MNNLEIYKTRFQSKLQRQGECLIYTGSKNPKGYGQFTNPWETAAHRFAWFVENGEIPKGLMVLHSCDTPPCCAIKHLRLGTAKENTMDMVSRNRASGPKIAPKGEKNPIAKITEYQATEIGKLISNGLTCPEIAKELNISLHIINGIRSRKTWKHIAFTVPLKMDYTKNCLVCNTKFRRKPFEYEQSKYCKYECYWKSMQKEKDKIICAGCSKEVLVLSRKDSLRKYCELSCLHESMKGKYPENIKKNQ